MLNVVIYYLQ